MALPIIDLATAFEFINNGDHIVTAMAASEPYGFFSGIDQPAMSLEDVTIFCANPSEGFSCFTDPKFIGHLEFIPMFLTAAISHFQGGNVHYAPQHLSRWTRNIARDNNIDLFWGSCSKIDARGFLSLGLSACYEPEIIRKARRVILEVNEHLPHTYGATTLHVSEVDYFIENNDPLPTLPTRPSSKVELQIGARIAELIEDGSTIQLGIGGIPNALAKSLATKKDLGVHTEMINDTIMELYLQGVINGHRKTLWPGKIIGSFAFGGSDLYRFLHKNPGVELHPSSIVNDPYRIGRNNKMVSINTAIEIDITGQVCSESIGHRELSGVGGAAETHCGAQRSDGGRGIIALTSRTNDQNSKIVFELKPGAKVSISRNDVDTVVTEYGTAQLAGRSVAERAKSLIQIAHPSVRDELTYNARKAQYI